MNNQNTDTKLVKYKPLAEKLTFGAAFIETLVVMPQVIQIFTTKSAGDISLFTWTGFEILNFIWLFYGIVNKNRVIIFYTTAYGLVQLLVIIGGMLYGAKWL